MPGSWLDPVDDLRHQSMVLVADETTYHLRTPGTLAYCDVMFAESYLMVLTDAEEDEALEACRICFPNQPQPKTTQEQEDERQMRMFE